MKPKYITQAIFNLAPNAEFSFTEDDIKTLEWHTPEIEKPSDDEILAEAQRLSEMPEKELTIADKLASVGLSIDELKAALA